MEDRYFKFELNEFLYNAGIAGLIDTLKYAEDYEDCCAEGEDYIIEGQTLLVSRNFIKNNNIGELFVKTLVERLGGDTRFCRVMKRKGELDKLYSDPKPDDKAWKKSADDIYKEFTDMLLKKSFKSGYVIIAAIENVQQVNDNDILALKTEKDYAKKKAMYEALHELLEQEEVRRILIFKDLLYTNINMFYADNKGNGAAFLSKRETDPALAYNEKFVDPMFAELETPDKAKTCGCIECGEKVKNATPLSTFVDTADDLEKKKSYYWNYKPDAYLCPQCAFVCSMAPFGFSYIGDDGVFINNNNDVRTLMAYHAALGKDEDESRNLWFRLYNIFTEEKLQSIANRLSNIQVIIRSPVWNKKVKNKKIKDVYSFNTVDKQTLTILNINAERLRRLKNKYIDIRTDKKDKQKSEVRTIESNEAKKSDEFINIYQKVVGNVLSRRSQYAFITRVMRIALSDGGQCAYLFEILLIQITQTGGDNMESNVKRAYIAKKAGECLREKLTGDLKDESDKENELRGLVYQMLNAVSLGNRDKFMELAIRTYSSGNMPVPDIFFNCFNSDEEFKQIGFAYLLGLKSEAKNADDKAKKDE